MAGGIKDSELLLFSVEGSTANFDSLALSLLLLTNIHAVSEPPRVTTLVLGVFLVLFDHALVHAARQVHHLTTDG